MRIFDKIKSIRIRSDKVIWILVMFFAMASMLAIFSSSTFRANSEGVSKMVILKEQMAFVAGGFGVLLFCYFFPMKWYRILAPVVVLGTLGLLAYAIFAGEEINGAQRTVKILNKPIQVLELAKVGLIFYFAYILEKWPETLTTVKGYFCRAIPGIACFCGLVLPNSASTVVLFGILSMLLLFFMGTDWKYILITIVVAFAALGLIFAIYNTSFKDIDKNPEEQNFVEKMFNRVGTSQHRIESFILDIRGGTPDLEKMKKFEKQQWLDKNRQSLNAKIAISEGGILGKGPGNSTSRYSLSMAFSDFIYAFIVEEYGLVGGIFIILLYTLLFYRGVRIAQKCSTAFPQTLAVGITTLIALQAMLHIYVNVRLLPITGHTLPFISHGGTAFLIFSGSVGILLAVSKQANKQENQEQTNIVEDEEVESDN